LKENFKDKVDLINTSAIENNKKLEKTVSALKYNYEIN